MAKHEFAINSTAAAFETLSKKLYSQPILAIIRELSTNANDAHIQAGNEDPFILHLPTDTEPYFLIRDFGTGMSEDIIDNVYTTFFCSTKSEDENQTGYFGLGSKSPYALIDEFEVTSWCDGMKKVYKMSKTDGIPNCDKIAETPSSEHSGLEIRFDYNKDFYTFKKTAVQFFAGTKFMPDWNIDDVDMEKYIVDRQFFTNNSICFKYLEDSSFYTNKYDDIWLNVAGVSFPVDVSRLGAKAETINDLLNKTNLYKMNICTGKSDVTITPSREELHYDQKTVDFISNAIEKNIKDRFAEFVIKDCTAKELTYLMSQSYDINLANAAREEVETYANPKVIRLTINSRRLTASASQVNIANTIGTRIYGDYKRIVLDTTGLSTVKEKVINGFLTGQTVDDKLKLTSTSLVSQLKQLHNLYSNVDTFFIYFSNNLDYSAKKLNADIVKFSSLEVSKEKKEAQKRGFLTKYSILTVGNVANYNLSMRPNVKDGEVPLIIKEEDQGNVDKYVRFITKFIPDAKLAIRPCKESVFDRLHKDYKTIEEYAKEIVTSNIATIQSTANLLNVQDNIEKFFGSSHFSKTEATEIEKVLKLPKYNELANRCPVVAYIKNNFNINNVNASVDSTTIRIVREYDIKATNNVNINPENNWKEKYPMLKYISYINTERDVEAILDYMNLVEKC